MSPDPFSRSGWGLGPRLLLAKMLRLHVNKTCFSPRNTGVGKFFYGIQSRLRSLYYLCSSYPSAPGAKYVSTRVPPVRLYPSAPSTSLPECPQCVSTRVLQVRLYPSGLYQSAPSVSLPECPRCQVRLYPSAPSASLPEYPKCSCLVFLWHPECKYRVFY